MPDSHPSIVLTPGDPSGIGPELLARLLADPEVTARARLSVTATEEELAGFASAAGVTVPGGVRALGTSYTGPPAAPARATPEGGARALADLARALDEHAAGRADAVMFLPLNKAALGQAGMREEDELRWFAAYLGFGGFTSEVNVVDAVVTARVTSHIPVAEVAAGVTQEAVVDTIALLSDVLRAIRTPTPRIAVCALNPHGGEGGKFGREEIDIIAPAVATAQERGVDVSGPFPSDTLFARAMTDEFDGVVTMYHDQGQIALKLMGFEQGVTVHGGLPVPIATPAHGTAYGIVGTNAASLGPTRHAFDLVRSLAERQASAKGATT